MKYFVLVWAGLWRKPTRTVLTSLSVATAFLLYGALSGTMVSFDKWMSQATGEVSILWTSSRISMSAGLPLGIVPAIERVDGVASVDFTEGFNSYWQDPKNGVGIVALDVGRRIRNPSPWSIVSREAMESMRNRRTGMIVGTALMKKYGWKIGDRVPLTAGVTRKDGSNVWVFDIVGTFDAATSRTSADQAWMNFDYFDEARAFGNGTVRGIVSVVPDPSRASAAAASIDELFANSPNETLTRSMIDVMRAELDQVTNIQLIINIVLSAVLFTLLFVTGNTMLQSTVERTPELAVLKTYGYSDALIGVLILVESLLLCVLSALIGMGLAAAVLFPVIGAAFEIGTLPMDPSVIAVGLAMAVALACVIALPPVWRARRLSVVDALAGR